MDPIPFNKPSVVGPEFEYMQDAIANRHLSGNGPFADRCTAWLEREIGSARALITHSCTGALEMSMILSDVGPGDEVIMPSFNFVSSANVAVLRGAVPVFVDIREDTLNLDERLVEAAITERTKAIVAVHYAGVACDLDTLKELADARGLALVEDDAQGLLATFRDRPLGSVGRFATLSFHESKNIVCGEGGALLVNDPADVERAEIIHEKGTDRLKLLRGQIDKYTWVDVGTSYVQSELNSAFLWAQLEHAEAITADRMRVWRRYHEAFAELEAGGSVRRPTVPQDREHNAHIYYLVLPGIAERDRFIARLREQAIGTAFHYVSLHASPAGLRYARTAGELNVTESVSDGLVRLPLWSRMPDEMVDRVIAATLEAAPR